MTDAAGTDGPASVDPLAFEMVLAELSAKFVGVPTDAIDAHIEAVIGRIADVLGLDRANVAQKQPETGLLAITHQWNRAGFAPAPLMSVNQLPWLHARIARREVVAVDRVEDLPPDAVEERERMLRYGVRSSVVLPLTVGGEVIGVLSFSALRRACVWTQRVLERIQLVAEIAASALFRKKAETALREALSFERLVSRLSADFVGVPQEDVDRHIEGLLRAIAEFLELDRAHVLQPQSADRTWRRTHRWLRPGLPVVPDTERGDAFPWMLGRLVQRREAVIVSRLQDLPEEAAIDREAMRSLGVRSGVLLPLVSGGEVTGILALSSLRRERSWTPDVIDRLRVCADVVANSLARSLAERQLRSALAEKESLQRQLEAENVYLREEIHGTRDFGEIVGQSALLRASLHKAEQVAGTDTPVLLVGETGTGKELVAHAIHARSRRGSRALIAVNCAALPATLVESELFGHEKGAFTGASQPKPGRFELADGGTLFLDEIGELDPAVQAKLLRALQDGEVQRLGATRPRKVDVRIVAATNRDLQQAMKEGRFRADLFYRLSVFPIELPPLRARREDIPLLVWYFIQARQRTLGRAVERLSRSAMDTLCAYDWPGNVRELQNVIERALILSPGPVLRVEEALGIAPARESAPEEGSEALQDAERVHIQTVLERCDWTIQGHGQAAERLQMRPSTLRSRMRKLGISRPS